jgi:hypothetical protein
VQRAKSELHALASTTSSPRSAAEKISRCESWGSIRALTLLLSVSLPRNALQHAII